VNVFRPHITNLVAYSSARDEFAGEATVFLDANENNWSSSGFHRYPGEEYAALKNKIAGFFGCDASSVFLGNGSDEIIDLIIRASCEPGKDKIVTCSPSYGMYGVAAQINDVEVYDVPFQNDYWDMDALQSMTNPRFKVLFICSPNNPTGAVMKREDLVKIVQSFPGTVVVDEAYIEFSAAESALELVKEFDNVIVTRTFSKAFGMAGLRLGWCVAGRNWKKVLDLIRPPYNVNVATAQEVLALDFQAVISQVATINNERERVIAFLEDQDKVIKVWPTESNFVLFEVGNAKRLYQELVDQGIIVRDRSSQIPNTLRVSVGTPEENDQFMDVLREKL